MCGFACLYQNKHTYSKKIIKKMSSTLKKRGPDDYGYYIDENILLGHRRLAIMDIKNGHQPMTYQNYTIAYNGEIYNMKEIKNDLIRLGYDFKTSCDTEVLLKGYIHYKEKILDKIEGIFAFLIYDGKSLFIARDRFGIKPLFYSHKNDTFIIASSVNAILKSNLVKPIINNNSLQELLGLGPSKSPGHAIFKDIYELRPACYMKIKNNHLLIKRYWQLKDEVFKDDFDTCQTKVKTYLTDSIISQMQSDVSIATLLSGGLDSSIITAVVASKLKNDNKTLDTFSIDYEDNDKYFKKNDYQISDDKEYIKKMQAEFQTNHKYMTIKQRTVAKYLKKSILAKDYPGMADIDSSLYWFCKKIKKYHKVILSGECADEIFGGYPWFYRKDLLNSQSFPWIKNLEMRESLLKEDIRKKLNIIEYVNRAYLKTLKEVPKGKNKKDKKHKELFYLNLIWFMPTLLERKDKMTMMASVEARVPFASTKLIEYLYNVPWEYKYYHETEKGLLRSSFKDILPESINTRKKNPYPKTHNPKYTKIVARLLKKALRNKKSILYELFDISKINELIETKGASYTSPWFGQLMTGPQLIAYLYQFDYWAKKYKIILELC